MLAELAERLPERGFDKLFQLIRRRGLVWNHKRVWRVYCLMQLNRRRRGKKRVPTRHPSPLVAGEQVSASWSINFMSDALWDGRRFRTFNVIDDFSREALGGRSRSQPARHARHSHAGTHCRLARLCLTCMSFAISPKYVNTLSGGWSTTIAKFLTRAVAG